MYQQIGCSSTCSVWMGGGVPWFGSTLPSEWQYPAILEEGGGYWEGFAFQHVHCPSVIGA